ncbi:hypothetical protein LCGC14_2206510, partial [marine sediment metagenome]
DEVTQSLMPNPSYVEELPKEVM